MNTQTNSDAPTVGSSGLFAVGDLVTVPIKNRWGMDCAATITAVHAGTVDATVWNMDGPGADREVTGIPFSECQANNKDTRS